MKKLIVLCLTLFLFSCEGFQENILPDGTVVLPGGGTATPGGGSTGGGSPGGNTGGGNTGGGNTGGSGSGFSGFGDGGIGTTCALTTWQLNPPNQSDNFWPHAINRSIAFQNSEFNGVALCEGGNIKIKVTNLPNNAELRIDGQLVGYGGATPIIYEVPIPTPNVPVSDFLHYVQITNVQNASGTAIHFEMIDVTGTWNRLTSGNHKSWTFTVL